MNDDVKRESIRDKYNYEGKCDECGRRTRDPSLVGQPCEVMGCDGGAILPYEYEMPEAHKELFTDEELEELGVEP